MSASGGIALSVATLQSIEINEPLSTQPTQENMVTVNVRSLKLILLLLISHLTTNTASKSWSSPSTTTTFSSQPQSVSKSADLVVPFIKDEFIMFGDSITQQAWQAGGTGSFLADRYQRKLSVLCYFLLICRFIDEFGFGFRRDLVNRGYSGYNSTFSIPFS